MRPELQAILTHCRNLPSPPGIALRVIELAQNPDADLATTVEVISMDMALSARMMRIANSPLYASRRRVDNLAQALTMLGLNTTLNLALGFSLVQGLRQSLGDQPPQERIWRRGLIAGLAARALGQARGLRKPEELLLAGLLQDIGSLALLQVEGQRYQQLLELAADNDSLLRLEGDELGADHAEVGAWLAEQWNLPEYLQNAIAQSDDTAETLSPFNACVALSGDVAQIWLDEDPAAARERAAIDAERVLNIDAERFDRVIERVAAALPEFCNLFEIQLTQPVAVSALVEQAHELATLRNLRELQALSSAQGEVEHHHAELTEQATRDALTGVYNRNQLSLALAQEFEMAKRRDHPLSIAFIDLDDFKKVNDDHGHLVGDEVLRNFARKLQAQLRNSDTVARFGGEEFLVLLPNTNAGSAKAVIERILGEIGRTPMADLDDGPLCITFSAGLATFDKDSRFADVEALLRAADDVLYRSKHLGRNRVTIHIPSSSLD